MNEAIKGSRVRKKVFGMETKTCCMIYKHLGCMTILMRLIRPAMETTPDFEFVSTHRHQGPDIQI